MLHPEPVAPATWLPSCSSTWPKLTCGQFNTRPTPRDLSTSCAVKYYSSFRVCLRRFRWSREGNFVVSPSVAENAPLRHRIFRLWLNTCRVSKQALNSAYCFPRVRLPARLRFLTENLNAPCGCPTSKRQWQRRD